MSLLVRCACGKRLKIDSSLLGKRVKCPACGQTVLAEEVDEVEEFVEVDEKKKDKPKKKSQRGFSEPRKPRERKAAGRLTIMSVTPIGWLMIAATLAGVVVGTVILLPHVNPAYGKEPYWVHEDMSDHLLVTIHNTKVGAIQVKVVKRRGHVRTEEGNTERDGVSVPWKVAYSHDAGVTEVVCDGKTVRKSSW